MPTNDFLPFAVGSSANVKTQSSWAVDPVLSSGFQSGVANSAQVNKVLRQASIMASMLGQFIADNSGQNATDDGTTGTLENNLRAAVNAIITTFVANALGSGGTIYSPQFASVSAATIDANGNGGQIRLTYGNYGVIFRNDGSNFYALLTNSGNANGTFNSFRPISVNLSTGAVTIDGSGVGTVFGGRITAPSAVISGNQTVSGTLTAGNVVSTGAASVTGTLTTAAINASGAVAATSLSAASVTASGQVNAGYLVVPGYDSGGMQIRMLSASYGAGFLNDGANFYLLTAAGTGSYTGLRPLKINLATGALTIDGTGAGTHFGGAVSAPTPSTGTRDTTLATTAMFANEFASYLTGGGGYQKLPSGFLVQWGYTAVNGSATINFPLTFPTQCFGIVSTDDGTNGASGAQLTSCSAISNSQFVAYVRVPSSGAAAAANMAWIAYGV